MSGNRDETPPIERERRFLIGMLAFGHLSNDWAAGSIWLIASAVAVAEGLGSAEVGWLLTIHGIGAALAYIPTGVIADRSARRTSLLTVTFLWVGCGYFIASFAPGFWWLSIMLAIAVMGDAAWHPIASGTLARSFPERRAHALGLHAMGGTIGAEVLAPIAAGVMLALSDWRFALRASALPALLAGAVFLMAVDRLRPLVDVAPSSGNTCSDDLAASGPRDRSVLDADRLLGPWVDRRGRAFVASIVLYNMAYMAVVSMAPLFLQRDLEFGEITVGVILATMLVIGSALQPFVGAASDRTGRRPLIMGGAIVGAVCATVAGTAESSWLAVLALIGVAGVLTAIRSVVLAGAAEMAAGRESANLAVAFTLMDGVGALGALAAGYIGRDSLQNAFLLAGGLSVLAAVASAGITSQNVRRATHPAP